ncbi:hypothetical protein [Actinokineospora globicatena]|uniref:hypothetical protein n=1 Tax=Actinokineospora globicatena TaxID=103729 RepID=UPI0024A2A762|nr:hypothetical protein [Actinokineospora globicatena]GLW77690.1 hypothetical protein Aglo01_21720 [Actinokineospora globicatena]GLW85641.1 hypothetical protein Aglo02_32810 [Actinokineospora globicatena]
MTANSPEDGPDTAHRRPHGVDDLTVEAVGKLSEALETVERARGHLYSFHQLTGSADFDLGSAADLFDKAGHAGIAQRLRTELVGRNVLPGRWTFQIVEEYDEDYYARVRAAEQAARDELLQGRRHVYESEMKEARRTRGAEGHEARP